MLMAALRGSRTVDVSHCPFWPFGKLDICLVETRGRAGLPVQPGFTKRPRVENPELTIPSSADPFFVRATWGCSRAKPLPAS